MGLRGPKKKRQEPDARRGTPVLPTRGTAQKGTAGDDVMSPVKPDWLSEHAADHWDAVVPRLIAAGVVRAVDSDLLANYCDAMGTVVYCREILKAKGYFIKTSNSPQMPRAEIKLAAQSLAVATKLAEQLGLTPKARQAMGISIMPPVSADEHQKQNTKARFFGK